MSSGTELLWPGAALLVLLGVAASLCVRCSRPGRRGLEAQPTPHFLPFAVVGQAWPGPLEDTAPTSWAFLPDPASCRYQNFSKGRWAAGERGRDPIAMEYYNWGRFRKPPEDDANSYENVLICKQKTTEPVAQQDGTGGLCRGDHIPSPALKTGPTSGLCPSASPEEDEESEDYQNSASIHQWRESRRVMGQLQRQASPGPVGSPDEEEDGEPDYVNGEVAATEA
uniref:Linker for activation of T cells family member 2 n=1 Tax=Macaca mulatta TaxID=9544 RepID=A0A1D5QFM2_MACMU